MVYNCKLLIAEHFPFLYMQLFCCYIFHFMIIVNQNYQAFGVGKVLIYFMYIYSMTKLFIHPSILNIFIHFSESNAICCQVFYLLISTKKTRNIKINFQNNRLNTTNLTGELCKIGKDKIIHIVENIVLN